MLNKVFSKISGDFKIILSSIKLMEIEETFDIYFSRFFGYYFAVLGRKLSMSPNQMSVASLVVGVIAGALFYFQDQLPIILIACLMITISGVLDSADGQLARMTGQVSDLGRKIDAIIDTFVFVACYTGGSFYYFFGDYSLWIVPLAMLAGYFHSVKSGVYEFYKTEFLYYTFRSDHFRIPYVDELKKPEKEEGFWMKLLYYLELDYIRKQAMFHGRSRKMREKFETYTRSQHEKFVSAYSLTNTRIMTWWALVCGTNTHRTAIMFFSVLGRLDLYFYFSIITFFPMYLIIWKQKKLDAQLLRKMENSEN